LCLLASSAAGAWSLMLQAAEMPGYQGK